MTFNLTSGNANTISTGTAGSNLKLDNGGGGVLLKFNGTGATLANTTISVPMVFDEDVTAEVNYASNSTTNITAQGAFNWTGSVTGGSGGFTKTGDYLMTMGTAGKAYQGTTELEGGRVRMSIAGRPTATPIFTIHAGAQLTPISAGSYQLGHANGILYLSGSGPTTGPFAFFPGAIRQDTGIDVAITNTFISLISNTLLHVQAAAGTGSLANPTGSLTFTNAIHGPGKLTLTGPSSNIDQGTLILNGTNDYTGGTLVAGGILSAVGSPATFGRGDVTVNNTSSPSSIARINIASGVSDALYNYGILSLLGGGTPGVADQNFAILGAGVDDIVGGLVLGGVPQLALGTYGATGSGANFVFDEYFSGTGVVRLVPEPSSLMPLCISVLGFVVRRRR
jgi:fibronectin-binding autotransporter adhesin